MNGKFVYKNLISWAIFGWLIFSGFAVQAFAGTSIKTFDFGAGGDNPTFRSHARTFALPQSVAIVIAVNYRTAGETGVPVIIEVEDAGNKIIASRETVAIKMPNRLAINIAASENTASGCERAWQVRVKTKNGEVPPSRVFGNITLSFVDPSAQTIEIENETFALNKGAQIARQIGGADSFRHPGIINIKAGWLHSAATLVLPLKFEIVRPDGTIAKTLTGYAVNSSGSPKLDFNYHITVNDAKQNGAWRLRIANNTEHNIIEINPKVSFTRRCFE